MNGVQLPNDIEGSIAIGQEAAWPYYVAIAFVLILLAFWLWRRPRKPKLAAEETIPQRIKRQLAELSIPLTFDPITQRDFSAELSLILRSCAEFVWNLPATDRTNEELRQILRNRADLPKDIIDELLQLLSQLDLIQFADQKLETDRAEILKSSARKLIDAWLGGMQ